MSTPSSEKALLAVSFGTSFQEARREAIEATETDLANAFPDFALKRAITSHQLSSARNDGERSGEFVSEVLAALAKDGYREVLVQPLHLIPGFEYAKIEREAALRADSFERLVVGKPLLADDDDFPAVAEAIRPIAATLQDDQALLLMGHGSRHAANQAYERMTRTLERAGLRRVYLATVEGKPVLSDVIPEMKTDGVRRVVLMPFMLVAGDHAHNDMASDNPDSWKSILTANGFEVRTRLAGLGELAAIREIYVRHAKTAWGPDAND